MQQACEIPSRAQATFHQRLAGRRARRQRAPSPFVLGRRSAAPHRRSAAPHRRHALKPDVARPWCAMKRLASLPSGSCSKRPSCSAQARGSKAGGSARVTPGKRHPPNSPRKAPRGHHSLPLPLSESREREMALSSVALQCRSTQQQGQQKHTTQAKMHPSHLEKHPEGPSSGPGPQRPSLERRTGPPGSPSRLCPQAPRFRSESHSYHSDSREALTTPLDQGSQNTN